MALAAKWGFTGTFSAPSLFPKQALMPACSWGTLCLEPPWETCTCHVKAPALPVAEADQSLSCYNAQAAGCSTSANKRAFNLYMCQDLPFSKQVSPHGSPKLSPLDELAGLGWAWTVFHPSFLFSLNKETFLTKNLPKLVYLYHSDGSHTHTPPPLQDVQRKALAQWHRYTCTPPTFRCTHEPPLPLYCFRYCTWDIRSRLHQYIFCITKLLASTTMED